MLIRVLASGVTKRWSDASAAPAAVGHCSFYPTKRRACTGSIGCVSLRVFRTVFVSNQRFLIFAGFAANYSEALAEAVVMNEVLPQLVYSLSEQNRYYKKTAAYVLKAVAKHSPDLAQAVVDAGALEALVGCLSEFEPTVKESAAWALGFIARHNASSLFLTVFLLSGWWLFML